MNNATEKQMNQALEQVAALANQAALNTNNGRGGFASGEVNGHAVYVYARPYQLSFGRSKGFRMTYKVDGKVTSFDNLETKLA